MNSFRGSASTRRAVVAVRGVSAYRVGVREFGARGGGRRDPLAQPEQAIRRLYSYVAYRIGPGPDAEDVVSETIERALRYRGSYDPQKGSPAAWLATIASRVLLDRYAAQRDKVPFEETDHSPRQEDPTSGSAQRIDFQQAMARLDERSREVLALRYGADLKAREIADILCLRTNTVEVALHRALERLRAILEEGDAPSGRTEQRGLATGGET